MDINQELIKFLQEELDMILQQDQQDRDLPLDQKIEKGIVIDDCSVIDIEEENKIVYLSCNENNSKFKIGDKLQITRNDSKSQKCDLLENTNHEVLFKCKDISFFEKGRTYRCEGTPFNQHKDLIKLLETLKPGMPGYGFLRLLDDKQTPTLSLENKTLAIAEQNIKKYIGNLSDNAQDILKKVFKFPQIFAVQGPPGTGKSHTLATIANIYYQEKKTVLILANSHQAVNNALSRIKQGNPNAHVIKVGQPLKKDNLDNSIPVETSYQSYYKLHKKQNLIVGMTLATALVQLGLHSSCLSPYVILIDEASQITLPSASILGLYRAPSMIFFGDEKQLPPIFVKEDSKFAISIFEYIKNRYPFACETLNKTYRLNRPICEMINQCFYPQSGNKPLFISVNPDNSFKTEIQSSHSNKIIREILNSENSLCYIEIDSSNCIDSNPNEASFIADLIEASYEIGLTADNLCVGTPYRKQAREISSCLSNKHFNTLPIIDTAERIQGIDRDMVIVSMCSSDEEYISNHSDFIFNKNRLNVMLSRAKTKIIICASEELKKKSHFFKSLIEDFELYT